MYIYIYLLTYYLPAFTVTRKKEKKRQEQEIKISRITTRGKKEKNIIGQKKKKKRKEKANFVTPVEKKSRDMQSVGQMNNKTHRFLRFKLIYIYIYILSTVFDNGPGDRGSIPG